MFFQDSRSLYTEFACSVFVNCILPFRDENGNWILYARSYATKALLDKVQVSVTVRKPTKANVDANKTNNAPTFSFVGRILPCDATEQQVIDSGSFLCLKDGQIRKLCVERTLFEYSVEVTEIK